MDNRNIHDESGIGLIEIVVSILLLGLLAVSVLPLLVNAMQTSQRNASISTASQVVSGQLEAVRSLPAPNSCAAVSGMSGSAAIITDRRGIQYQPQLTVGTCPALYPGVVTVTARVTAVASGDELAVATTEILVEQP